MSFFGALVGLASGLVLFWCLGWLGVRSCPGFGAIFDGAPLVPGGVELVVVDRLPKLARFPDDLGAGCTQCRDVLCLAVGLLLRLWVLVLGPKVGGANTCELRVSLV